MGKLRHVHDARHPCRLDHGRFLCEFVGLFHWAWWVDHRTLYAIAITHWSWRQLPFQSCRRPALLQLLQFLYPGSVGDFDGVQLSLVFSAGATVHDLLQQPTSITIGLQRSFEVLSIVQQHRSVRLLQRLGKHGLLVFLRLFPCSWPSLAYAVRVAHSSSRALAVCRAKHL